MKILLLFLVGKTTIIDSLYVRGRRGREGKGTISQSSDSSSLFQQQTSKIHNNFILCLKSIIATTISFYYLLLHELHVGKINSKISTNQWGQSNHSAHNGLNSPY